MRECIELGSELLTAAAHAGASRVARLRPETANHAVEDDSVIEALTYQFLDSGNMFRCRLRQQFNYNATIFEVEIKSVFFVHGLKC